MVVCPECNRELKCVCANMEKIKKNGKTILRSYSIYHCNKCNLNFEHEQMNGDTVFFKRYGNWSGK